MTIPPSESVLRSEIATGHGEVAVFAKEAKQEARRNARMWKIIGEELKVHNFVRRIFLLTSRERLKMWLKSSRSSRE